MPSTLRRRFRQSLRLDQHSRQMLESQLNISTDIIMKTASPPSGQSNTIRRRSSSSKHRARPRSRFLSRPSTTSKFLPRRSNASIQARIPGAVLPAELLLRIFHLGTELYYEFPVTVSQVCSHWRLLALRSPKLWQLIRPDGRRVLCAKRIRRAKGHPLHVEIAISSKSGIKTPALMDAHLRMVCVLPTMKQWQSLSISFDVYAPFLWNSVLSGLCDDPSRLASCVQELVSISLIYPANDDTKEFHLFGDYAPKLRNVTLHGIRLRWSPALFESLFYLDYTHHGFTVGHEAVQEVLAMLSVSCKSLRTLCIRFPKSPGTGQSDVWFPPMYRPIELPILETLTIRADGDSHPAKELKMLVSKLLIPSLITLELDVVGNPTGFSRKAVKSMVMPFLWHRQIERLIVRKAWNHRRCIDSLIRSLPKLMTLEREEQ